MHSMLTYIIIAPIAIGIDVYTLRYTMPDKLNFSSIIAIEIIYVGASMNTANIAISENSSVIYINQTTPPPSKRHNVKVHKQIVVRNVFNPIVIVVLMCVIVIPHCPKSL